MSVFRRPLRSPDAEALGAGQSPERVPSAVETGPMSAVIVTPRTPLGKSMVMAGASIVELDLDDGPTDLSEPYFEEGSCVLARHP
jgi:hypothetical protein